MEGCSELLEKVTKSRAKESLKEVLRHYPSATVISEVRNDRGIITVCQDRFILSKEFVETEESLASAHCMAEYGRILMGKARLVLIVPKELAARTRTKLLEFNNFWLMYYLVFYYDPEGNIMRLDRKAWCRMLDRPYDDVPRAPEIV